MNNNNDINLHEYSNPNDASSKEEIHAEITSDGNADFERQIHACQQELSQWKDQCMRLAADFENFKKRLEKERIQTLRVVKGNLLSDLLPVVDNIERALQASSQSAVNKDLLQGFEMINKELAKVLKKQGVEEIIYSATFNPEMHEAIMTVSSDAHNPGEVVQILEKGYTLDGAVLRPAKVSVAQ